jgi:hypothetical protein
MMNKAAKHCLHFEKLSVFFSIGNNAVAQTKEHDGWGYKRTERRMSRGVLCGAMKTVFSFRSEQKKKWFEIENKAMLQNN